MHTFIKGNLQWLSTLVYSFFTFSCSRHSSWGWAVPKLALLHLFNTCTHLLKATYNDYLLLLTLFLHFHVHVNQCSNYKQLFYLQMFYSIRPKDDVILHISHNSKEDEIFTPKVILFRIKIFWSKNNNENLCISNTGKISKYALYDINPHGEGGY